MTKQVASGSRLHGSVLEETTEAGGEVSEARKMAGERKQVADTTFDKPDTHRKKK